MILLLTRDLMATSLLDHAARDAGVSLQTLAPTAELPQAVRLVLLDLSSVDDVTATIARLREAYGEAAQLVAYGPHVHAEKLAAARRGGCDQVLTRGQLQQQGPQWIAEVAAAVKGHSE